MFKKIFIVLSAFIVKGGEIRIIKNTSCNVEMTSIEEI